MNLAEHLMARRKAMSPVERAEIDARLDRIEKLLENIVMRLATSRWSPKDAEPDSR